jgi:hypothetical protein
MVLSTGNWSNLSASAPPTLPDPTPLAMAMTHGGAYHEAITDATVYKGRKPMTASQANSRLAGADADFLHSALPLYAQVGNRKNQALANASAFTYLDWAVDSDSLTVSEKLSAATALSSAVKRGSANAGTRSSFEGRWLLPDAVDFDLTIDLAWSGNVELLVQLVDEQTGQPVLVVDLHDLVGDAGRGEKLVSFAGTLAPGAYRLEGVSQAVSVLHKSGTAVAGGAAQYSLDFAMAPAQVGDDAPYTYEFPGGDARQWLEGRIDIPEPAGVVLMAAGAVALSWRRTKR